MAVATPSRVLQLRSSSPTEVTAGRDSNGPVTRRGTDRAAWLFVAGASAIVALALATHVMWFDEIQAWNIARASTSLGSLYSNLRYEGHPALWYVLLFGVTRLTANPIAMQVAEWAIVTTAIAVIVRRAPFPLAARLALVFGYLMFFEYGVVGRAYGLQVLLLVLGLTWLARPEPAWGRATLAFAFLGWTSLAGGVLAIAVALAVVWMILTGAFRESSAMSARRPIVFVSAVMVSAFVAAVTCIPPSDFVSFSTGIPSGPLGSLSASRAVAAATGPWRGFAPLPGSIGGWNTNVLDSLPHAIGFQALLSVFLVLAVGGALRRHRFAFRIWVLGSLGAYAFSVIVVLPDRAHYAGVWFLLLVTCAWFAATDSSPSVNDGARASWLPLSTIVGAVLVVQVIASMAIVPAATVNPFSPDRELARTAVSAGLRRDVVSAQDYEAVTMSGYLEVPVWSLARNESVDFFVSDEREKRGNARLSPLVDICRAGALARARGHAVGLVVDADLPSTRGMRLLISSQSARLYRVTPAAAGGCR